LAVGSLYPLILPRQVRQGVNGVPYFVWIYAAASLALLAYMLYSRISREQSIAQRSLYVTHGLGLCFFLIFIAKMMIATSPARSAKPLAEKALPQISANTQAVFYDTYLAGMAFYLRAKEPLWLITHSTKKRTFLGNYYALGKRDPVTPSGRGILDFEEFRERWNSTSRPLLVILKEKNLERLIEELGTAPKKLAAIDEYLLVTKP
jgi:hypothetical protein